MPIRDPGGYVGSEIAAVVTAVSPAQAANRYVKSSRNMNTMAFPMLAALPSCPNAVQQWLANHSWYPVVPTSRFRERPTCGIRVPSYMSHKAAKMRRIAYPGGWIGVCG